MHQIETIVYVTSFSATLFLKACLNVEISLQNIQFSVAECEAWYTTTELFCKQLQLEHVNQQYGQNQSGGITNLLVWNCYAQRNNSIFHSLLILSGLLPRSLITDKCNMVSTYCSTLDYCTVKWEILVDICCELPIETLWNIAFENIKNNFSSFPSSLVPLFQSESKCENHSYENDFDLHENETAFRSHFHMKAFALILILKQRHKRTRKWRILCIFYFITQSPELTLVYFATHEQFFRPVCFRLDGESLLYSLYNRLRNVSCKYTYCRYYF